MSSLKFQCLTSDSNSQIYSIDENNGINSSLISYFNNTTNSINSSIGSIIVTGGLSLSNTTNASSITNGGSLTIAGGLAVQQDSFLNRISAGRFRAGRSLYFNS